MKYINFLPRFYPESQFGGFTDVDGTIAFYGRINAICEPSFCVVDLGCGRGKHTTMDKVPYRRNLRSLKGKVAKVIGLDVDPVGVENTSLDEFRLIEIGKPWPLEDNSVNLVMSNCVLEHVTDPDFFFAELARVLVPGGYMCIKTANGWAYHAVAARLIPTKLHDTVLSWCYPNYQPQDTFPTVYKCNTVFALRKIMKKYGFKGVAYGYESESNYLSFSTFTYWLSVLHQRFAPGFMKLQIIALGQLEK